jgi:ligand-binding sensor domain-containing protein
VVVDDGFVNLESQVFQLAALYSDSPDVPGGLLAATWDGLFVTTDEKKGWKPMRIVGADGAVLTKAPINALATHPQAQKLIWIGTEEGLFVSKDAGNSFTKVILGEDADRIKAIVFDPRKVDTVFVGTTVGFFLTNDGGRRFERRGGGMPEVIGVSAIEVSSANPDELFVGDSTHGTFYVSHNSGRNWEPVDISSLPSRRIFALATDPFDRNRVYAGSFSGGVYVLSRQGDERR